MRVIYNIKIFGFVSLLVVLASCADSSDDDSTDDDSSDDTVSTSEESPSTPSSGTINVDLGVAGSSEDSIPDEDGEESSDLLPLNILNTTSLMNTLVGRTMRTPML